MGIESVVYVDGERIVDVPPLDQTYDVAVERSGVAWIVLSQPTHDDLAFVSDEFDLHILAVEDTVKAHQRAKLERYGDTLFMVLKSARYLDEPETIEFGELHVFAGPNFVVSVRHHGAPDMTLVRDRIEREGHILDHNSLAILYAILDSIVDGYAPVVAGLENDIDEIEEQVFAGSAHASRRVYELLREVLEFQRATKPLADIIATLMSDFPTEGNESELHRYLRDVQDHVTRINERVDGFQQLLQNILNVNLTIVSLSQNEEIKKISAWAAILFAPTLVGTIYGMNFRHMPELDWLLGYPFAILLMGMVCVALYLVFSRRGWL